VTAAVRVDDLRKRYGNVRALDGFTLTVDAGELVGLVGPNGAGKTTLIRILATLTQPDGGHASILGYDVARARVDVRRAVGYLPDVAGVYPDMRVQEFLEFFADALHLGTRRAARVSRALAIAGLESRRQAFVEELSLGLKQRLVLARTLLHEPRVLLLDEPATGLDPAGRIELRELLVALNRDGVTVLLSSHVLADLQDVCSRVVYIAEGRNAGGDAIVGLTSVPFELEVLTEEDGLRAEAAAEAAGARLKRLDARRFATDLPGDAEAAALLASLVAAGVRVSGFAPNRQRLEVRYRAVFGGKPS
jgi:ABC-2 type transport system ATP-binding protein